MVGRLRGDTLAIYGNGTSPVWNGVLETLQWREGAGFEMVLSESGVGPSDHTSFTLLTFLCLHFFTGQHEDYHKPTDTADKLNYEGMVRVADFAACIVENWRIGFHPFYQNKGQFQRRRPSFKVTLGVVPDYLFSGVGMRIDGVSEGTACATRGLQKGDVVVRIGEVEVADMMGYMEGLSKFEEGQTTALKSAEVNPPWWWR